MKTDLVPIHVLLVDDHRTTLWGLAELIGGEAPRLEVAGMAANSEEALCLAQLTQPEVILFDVDLGGDNGLDLIPELQRACGAHIVILTGMNAPGLRRQVTSLGARGFVRKEEPVDHIIAAIQEAA